MKQENFEIFIPISKSIKSDGEHGRFIRGWASVPKEDRDGDIILPTELNINSFMRIGYINYEHKKGGKYKLANPTDKSYLDPKRGFFLEAKLFEDNPYADKMWDLAEKVHSGKVDVDDDHMLGFSIEAHFSHRDYNDPRILRNVTVSNVALTTHPSNTSSSWTTFEKSFTTGDSIVEDGDTGGAAMRRQSFARDIRELSYRIKDFTAEDWSEICKSLDSENRYDSNVAKTLNYLSKSTLDNSDEPDNYDNFYGYISNMIGQPLENREDNNLNDIEKSTSEVEENAATETETAQSESNVQSEAPQVSESESEVTSESASETEVESESESSAISEPDTSSESTSESETSSSSEETTENTESEPATEVESETPVVSESQQDSEAPQVSESESEVTSESASETEVESESESSAISEPDTSSESTSESESQLPNEGIELSDEVKHLTDTVDKLKKVIDTLKEELDGKKIDIPDITNSVISDSEPEKEVPSRNTAVEEDASQAEERPSIAQEEELDEENTDDSDQVPGDGDEKVESFVKKLEDNLADIRYKLLPSEFIEFNNALRHLRSGSATEKDGQVLQDTLKTVDLRSKVQ